MKIITDHLSPVQTNESWIAYVEDMEGQPPHGLGMTEAAALRDLAEQLAVLWLEKPVKAAGQ